MSAGHPAFQQATDIIGNCIIFDLVNCFPQEREREHILSLSMRNPPGGEIKQGRFIDRTDRRAVRARHIVSIDFQFRFGLEGAVFIQQKPLANLIAVGFLGIGLHKDLALKHACGAVAKNLFEDLAAFAVHSIVRNEHRVIMVKGTIASTSARNSGMCIIACEFDDRFVSRQDAIYRQRK